MSQCQQHGAEAQIIYHRPRIDQAIAQSLHVLDRGEIRQPCREFRLRQRTHVMQVTEHVMKHHTDQRQHRSDQLVLCQRRSKHPNRDV